MVLVGIHPARLEPGLELAPEVRSVVPHAVEAVHALVRGRARLA